MNPVENVLEEISLGESKRVVSHGFDEYKIIHELKHYLPAQAPLKDFVHHNTLHAFQYLKFYDALRVASERFGYNVSLSLEDYRSLYKSNRIKDEILDRVLEIRKGVEHVVEWKRKIIYEDYTSSTLPRIGALRSNWKRNFRVDLDSLVHPILFRILCSYLDQGVSMWSFPVWHQGFLASIAEMERTSFTSFFRTKRARSFLIEGKTRLPFLLKILVGEELYFGQYLFDQQFAHQGWSGMVSTIEDQPQTLLDPKNITLRDLIVFECLLEIDALDFEFGEIWSPLSFKLENPPVDLFSDVPKTEINEALNLWQDAYEWTYYDEVLAGIKWHNLRDTNGSSKTFQAMFCIDDRECSFRRHLELSDPHCETYGTPGFFAAEFYFKPEGGKFVTKVCPAPMNPKYMIKEIDASEKLVVDAHFAKTSHSLLPGWIISQTLGFWSAFKLFINIFRPSMSPATASSFSHMDKVSKLTIENDNPDHTEDGLQVGYTIAEMAERVEALLNSIGLLNGFAPIVYVIGHGASSVNNPHYAAYDCGACSGRPGSVNARVFSFMANHSEVRNILRQKGIDIPDTTQFIGGLHDTTRDEVAFYDDDQLNTTNTALHGRFKVTFEKALTDNAKERSRRFESINSKRSPKKIHKKVKLRSVSLFEPRPELNHATNALCIIGRRSLTKDLFLDRRAFLNSYDYRNDPTGKYLLGILRPAAPVCGGINLEYYFSRVDNQKLGAGTKLPHNVMGLFGVANGIDGDLRPGLPSQMIEVHDPIRLLMIVEHYPNVVLETIQQSPETYEWFINEWVHLSVINPETREISVLMDGIFQPYEPVHKEIPWVSDIDPLIEGQKENLSVYSFS